MGLVMVNKVQLALPEATFVVVFDFNVLAVDNAILVVVNVVV